MVQVKQSRTVLLQPGKKVKLCFKHFTSFAGVEIALVVGLNWAEDFPVPGWGAFSMEAGILSLLCSLFLPPRPSSFSLLFPYEEYMSIVKKT